MGTEGRREPDFNMKARTEVSGRETGVEETETRGQC